MLLDVAVTAVLLVLGNVAFWQFEPRLPLWRRLLKVLAALAITAITSYYFCRTGVMIWPGIAALPCDLLTRDLAPAPWRERLDWRATGEVLRTARVAACRSAIEASLSDP
jgi:hypothetical protein